MKISVAIIVSLAVIFTSATALTQKMNRLTSAKYRPVTEFLEADSTLSQWFKQYVDTTSGAVNFNDFLRRLGSEILRQRSRRAGLTHNQLQSPIVTLAGKDWNALDSNSMSKQELDSIRRSMLELDIVLAAIDATLPDTSLEEFRREVLRGAKPLTEVAKLPMSAVEAMTFTIMGSKVSERINNPPAKKTPPKITTPEMKPYFPDNYRGW